VAQLKVPNEQLKQRILGRLIHKPSGWSYQVKFIPPKEDMKDDVTGEPLIRRGDDNAESLTKRLVAFDAKTAPVVQHYAAKGCVAALVAVGSPSAVWALVQTMFGGDAGRAALVDGRYAARGRGGGD